VSDVRPEKYRPWKPAGGSRVGIKSNFGNGELPVRKSITMKVACSALDPKDVGISVFPDYQRDGVFFATGVG